MKRYTLTFSALMVFLFAGSLYAQVFGTNCPTLEEQQAAYNRSKAAAIVVRDTASQQLQCHYTQLATYYQQLNTAKQQEQKNIQQIQKDEQQKLKDIQQLNRDAQLYEWEGIINEKIEALNSATGTYDEVKTFIECIIPYVGECSEQLKKELIRIHTNRSGHMDGTNPGGQDQNINGFDNPSFVVKK